MLTILPLYSLDDSIAHVIEDSPNASTTGNSAPSLPLGEMAIISPADAWNIANNAPHRTLVFT